MSDPTATAPSRLLDDPQLHAALRRDLELASSHPPIAYDATAGLARFEQTLAAGVGQSLSASAGPTSVVTGARLIGWLVSATVLLGGAGGATWILGQAEADHRVVASAAPTSASASGERREGAEVAERSSSATAADHADEVAAPDRLAPANAAEPAALEDPSELAGSTSPQPPKAQTPDPAPPRVTEAEQINAARKALERDPATALALIESAAQMFPDGAMIQERDGYAILALIALDRRTEAEARAPSYLARWPKGPLSRRVRDALEP